MDMSNSWIGKKARQAIYDRDNMVCCYCGKTCVKGNTRDPNVKSGDCATLDHIVPQKELAESSTNDAEFYRKRKDAKNLVVVCMSCNSSKQHLPLYVWCAMQGKNYASIIGEISTRIEKPLY
jgi:5-methylcytosine-specific restriction endonuclease McrA